MNRIYQGKVTTVKIPSGKNDCPPCVQPPEIKMGLRIVPAPMQELRFNSQPGLVADRLKKSGAAKAPYGSHRFNLSAEAARLFPTYRGRSTGFDLRSS
jgi:hypothetical protein